MIRIAAVGDVHFAADTRGTLRPALENLHERADCLLLAGDLTRAGATEEAEVLAEELDGIAVPTFGVLGNHDYHCGNEKNITQALEEAGVKILEGTSAEIEVGDQTLGIAGTKGFGGGFAGACGTDFGEYEMKAFIRHTKEIADELETALDALDTDARVVVLHYSPVRDTLKGEHLEIYPFLGSYLLAEAIDRAGADLIVHGHAHGGIEKGVTAGGIHVRNVAMPVVRKAYGLYCLGGQDGNC